MSTLPTTDDDKDHPQPIDDQPQNRHLSTPEQHLDDNNNKAENTSNDGTLHDMLSTALATSPTSTMSAEEILDNDDYLEKKQLELQQKALFLLGLSEKIQQEFTAANGDIDTVYEKSYEILKNQEELKEGIAKTKEVVNKIPKEDQEKANELLKILHNDAKVYLSYALDIKNHLSDKKNNIEYENQMLDKIRDMDTFTSNVKDKYLKYSDHVMLRSSKILKNTIDSDEAREFLTVGKSIINKWVKKRHVILEQQNIAGVTADLDQKIDNLDNSMQLLVSNHTGDVVDFISSIRVDAVLFMNSIDKHKQTVLNAADEIKQVIEQEDEKGKLKDDEDVKALLALGKSGHESIKKIVSSATDSENVDKTSKKIQKGTDDVFDHLEKHEIGKQALKRGSELLNKYSDDLDPENFLEKLSDLKESKEKRQRFISTVKNELLSFLLEYLPKIKIKPLEVDDDNCKYSLSNIDLSKFEVRAENVDVTLIEEKRSVLLSAHSINCEMSDLKFSYKSKTFPYPSANGSAKAVAKNISIGLELRLEEVIDDEFIPEEQLLEHNDSPRNDNNHITTTCIGETLQNDQFNSNNVEKKDLIEQIKDETTGKTSKTKEIIRSINVALDDAAQYRLVLVHHPEVGIVHISDLELELTDFWLKSLANLLLSMFKTSIQAYITKTINVVIIKESSHLLKKINDAVATYLPILGRVLTRVEGKTELIENIVVDAAKQIQKDVLVEKRQFERQQREQQLQQQQNDGEVEKSLDGTIPTVEVKKLTKAQPKLQLPEATEVLDLKKKPKLEDTPGVKQNDEEKEKTK